MYDDVINVFLFNVIAKPSIQDWIIEAQRVDRKIHEICSYLEQGEQVEGWTITRDESFRFSRRKVVPDNDPLKRKLLSEVHRSKNSIDIGSNKIYQDLRHHIWWKKRIFWEHSCS